MRRTAAFAVRETSSSNELWANTRNSWSDDRSSALIACNLRCDTAGQAAADQYVTWPSRIIRINPQAEFQEEPHRQLGEAKTVVASNCILDAEECGYARITSLGSERLTGWSPILKVPRVRIDPAIHDSGGDFDPRPARSLGHASESYGTYPIRRSLHAGTEERIESLLSMS
jgi:hypothetical protein